MDSVVGAEGKRAFVEDNVAAENFLLGAEVEKLVREVGVGWGWSKVDATLEFGIKFVAFVLFSIG